jgi:23S rRNA (uracil1939-C5)-methyltransferase
MTYRGYTHLEGDECLEHSIHGIKYKIPNAGFFQTNYIQAENLLDTVLAYIAPGEGEDVCDIYSGCGFFSLPLAKRAKSVTCIESTPLSHNAGILNAKTNNITNAGFINNDAGRALKTFRRGSFNSAVLDPPRMGCERPVLEELIRIQPAKIVYISCSTEILIRDLRILMKGGYFVSKCQPVDMFPHTYHIENVVQLIRRG